MENSAVLSVGSLLGILTLGWKFIGAAKDSATREARQNARLEALEKQAGKWDVVAEKIDAMARDLHALRVELKARGLLNGAKK